MKVLGAVKVRQGHVVPPKLKFFTPKYITISFKQEYLEEFIACFPLKYSINMVILAGTINKQSHSSGSHFCATFSPV
jgi:hypothetical protein